MVSLPDRLRWRSTLKRKRLGQLSAVSTLRVQNEHDQPVSSAKIWQPACRISRPSPVDRDFHRAVR